MKETHVSAHFLAKQHGGRLEVATKPGPFACLRQSAMSATRRAHRIPRISAGARSRLPISVIGSDNRDQILAILLPRAQA